MPKNTSLSMPLVSIDTNRFDNRAEFVTVAHKTYRVGFSASDLIEAERGGYYPEMPKWFFPRPCHPQSTLPSKPILSAASIEAMKKKSERRRDREERRRIKDTLFPKAEKQSVLRRNECGRREHVAIYRKTPRYYLNVVLSALRLTK